jgi:hypothetical protein
MRKNAAHYKCLKTHVNAPIRAAELLVALVLS